MFSTKRLNAPLLFGALTAMLLSGCKDDNFDLSDIDTTMKFEIKDLILPLNVEPITFDDMVDLDSEECIEVIDGQYVLIKNGDFESDQIKIKRIDAKATMSFDAPDAIPVVARANEEVPLNEFAIPINFHYDSDEVDEYICRIDSGKVDMKLVYTIQAAQSNGRALPCEFRDMTFELPAGFYGKVNGAIDITRETGNIITLPDASPDSNGNYIMEFDMDSFDFETTQGTLDGTDFFLGTQFALKSGKVHFTNESKGESGSLKVSFSVSDMEVQKISGVVYYKVQNLNPERVELNDLPDVLTDERTNVGLENPQLYVKVTNPLASYEIPGSTGLTVSQIRDDNEMTENQATLDNLTIKAVDGVQNFCLSPICPENYYSEYSGSDWDQFNGLGNIISGNGLPQALKLDFDNPEMNHTEVTNFTLGENMGTVHGNYTLFAPLALTAGSIIYYEEDSNDWGLSDDDNSLNIEYMSLTANCVSELPVNVKLYAYPLDSNGEKINIKRAEVDVKAGASTPIELLFEGEMNNLDGMHFMVVIDTEDMNKVAALQPTQHLTLKNLKVKLTGSYLIEDSND